MLQSLERLPSDWASLSMPQAVVREGEQYMDHPVHLGGEAFVLTELKVTPIVEKKQPGRWAPLPLLGGALTINCCRSRCYRRSCCTVFRLACQGMWAGLFVLCPGADVVALLPLAVGWQARQEEEGRGGGRGGVDSSRAGCASLLSHSVAWSAAASGCRLPGVACGIFACCSAACIGLRRGYLAFAPCFLQRTRCAGCAWTLPASS